MTAKTHMVGGILCGELAALYLFRENPVFSVVCVATAVAGSVLPDIDSAESHFAYKSLKNAFISAGVNAIWGHRGAVHTPFAALILALILYASGQCGFAYAAPVAAGVTTGFLSHLVLDSLNYGGIMWLFPFKKRRYHWGKIPIRSFKENTLALCLLLACAALTLRYMETLPADFGSLLHATGY